MSHAWPSMDYNALKVADLDALPKERSIASTGMSRKKQITDALVSHDVGDGGGNGGEEKLWVVRL